MSAQSPKDTKRQQPAPPQSVHPAGCRTVLPHLAKDTEETATAPPDYKAASLLGLRVFSLYPLHPAYKIVCFFFFFLCSIK